MCNKAQIWHGKDRIITGNVKNNNIAIVYTFGFQIGGQVSRSIDKYLRKAALHIKSGEVVQAEVLYKKVLSKFPKNIKAIQGYQKLKTPPQAEIDRLISLFNNNRFRAAVSLGTTLTEQFPGAVLLYEILGAANMGLGNTDETIINYQKVLQIKPEHTDACNNLGMVFYEQGKFSEAVKLYQKAVEVEPGFADAHYNLGNALKQTGDLRKAIESYRVSFTINPNDVEVLSEYSHALKDYGEFEQAIECYKKVLKIDPNIVNIQTSMNEAINEKIEINDLTDINRRGSEEELSSAQVIFFKGTVLNLKGYQEAAIDCFNRALFLRPDYAECYFNIGGALRNKGELSAAIDSYKMAIKINPDYAEAHHDMGIALKEIGEVDAAIESYEKAVKIKPDYAAAYSLMGVLFSEKEENALALKSFQQAVTVQPEFAEAHFNLGNHLKRNTDPNAAITSFRRALKIKPYFAECHNNLGNCLVEIGKPDEAIKNFQQATKINPSFAEAHFNESLSLLRTTEFILGWPAYEWRWKSKSHVSVSLGSTKPRWCPPKKNRVLLWAEQGIGDEIMFASLIPDLNALCAKLIVQVDKRLIPLFRRSFPNDIDFRQTGEVVSETEYDAHIPMGSLPQHFRQTIDSFKPASKGWLSACDVKTSSLRKKLLSDGSETLIGISWHSTKPRRGAENKLITLRQIAKSLYAPKVKLINLQYGEVNDELNRLRKELDIDVIQVHEIDNKNDIDDLAALIMACDKVISISNVTIHLAGALGKEAQVLLAFASDWRWGYDCNNSHWYDSVKLHRQAKIGDWNNILKQLSS